MSDQRRKATKKEAGLIQKILNHTAQIRALAAKREELFGQLAETAANEILILEVKTEEGRDTRAMKVAKPKGKYVMIPQWDFTVNRQPTKADLEGV